MASKCPKCGAEHVPGCPVQTTHATREVVAENEKLRAELDQLKADRAETSKLCRAQARELGSQDFEIKRLRGALEWYADEMNYVPSLTDDGVEHHCEAEADCGERAKEALQATESEKSNKGEVPG